MSNHFQNRVKKDTTMPCTVGGMNTLRIITLLLLRVKVATKTVLLPFLHHRGMAMTPTNNIHIMHRLTIQQRCLRLIINTIIINNSIIMFIILITHHSTMALNTISSTTICIILRSTTKCIIIIINSSTILTLPILDMIYILTIIITSLHRGQHMLLVVVNMTLKDIRTCYPHHHLLVLTTTLLLILHHHIIIFLLHIIISSIDILVIFLLLNLLSIINIIIMFRSQDMKLRM